MKDNVKESSSGNPAAKPARLSELVEYQEGSIVSRSIIDKETTDHDACGSAAFPQGAGEVEMMLTMIRS